MKSTVSAKGQITLPGPVREKLGLRPGTPVQFELREDGVLVRKGVRGDHPVDRIFGRLRLPKPVDVLVDEMRRPPPVTGLRGAGRPRARRRPRPSDT
jgi:AbrB family looped-hinge helix DNA binding protein